MTERIPREPPRDPEKAARDDARAMAILQRMLREQLDGRAGSHQTAVRLRRAGQP